MPSHDIKKRVMQLSLLALIALFIYGFIHFFTMRFEKGDIYPPYSSFRTDPLGSRGFFDALNDMPGIRAMHNVSPLHDLSIDETQSCLLFIGTSHWDMATVHPKTADKLEQFLSRGGTILFSLKPAQPTTYDDPSGEDNPDHMKKDKEEPPKSSPEKPTNTSETKPSAPEALSENEKNDPSQSPRGIEKTINLFEMWNIKPLIHPADYQQRVLIQPDPAYSNSLLPEMAWPFTIGFEFSPPPLWQPVYRVDQWPVIAERKVDKGRLILVADSYFFSNESLRNDKKTRLLAWIIGDASQVIFDETHLGIRKKKTISQLIQGYRLDRVAFVLGVMMLLFVWKNSASFLPPETDEKNDGLPLDTSGRDHSTGMATLLKHHIKKSELIDLCLAEWKKAFVHKNQSSQKARTLYDDLCKKQKALQKEKEPSVIYNHLADIILKAHASHIKNSGVDKPKDNKSDTSTLL